MSSFLISKSISLKLGASFRKFWWGENSYGNSFLPKIWDSICLPKFVGGLGFRRTHDTNKALIAKLARSVAASHDKLSVKLLSAKYIGFQPFLSSGFATSNSSWIWKDILSTKKLIIKGPCLTISSNYIVRIWDDHWIPTLLSFKPTPNPHTLPHFPMINFVRSLMLENTNCCNNGLLLELFPIEEVK